MQAVIEYLRANQQTFIDQLCEYVRFPSVSAQPQHRQDLHACAQWVVKQCQDIGLDARLCPTEGHPIIVARTPLVSAQGRRPRYLIYGHYDVQPPEPFELWKSPPFEPVIRAGKLFGRGASDNKGQFFAHVKAIEALRQTDTPVPVDVVFLIEGEEEVGSGA